MEINITLAGANFRPAEAKAHIKDVLSDGDTCTLVRESDNPYDERAVQIHHGGQFIGFVPKSDNLLLSQAMDLADINDETFEYTCVCTGFIGTLQPTFNITWDESQGWDEFEDDEDGD